MGEIAGPKSRLQSLSEIIQIKCLTHTCHIVKCSLHGTDSHYSCCYYAKFLGVSLSSELPQIDCLSVRCACLSAFQHPLSALVTATVSVSNPAPTPRGGRNSRPSGPLLAPLERELASWGGGCHPPPICFLLFRGKLSPRSSNHTG